MNRIKPFFTVSYMTYNVFLGLAIMYGIAIFHTEIFGPVMGSKQVLQLFGLSYSIATLTSYVLFLRDTRPQNTVNIVGNY